MKHAIYRPGGVDSNFPLFWIWSFYWIWGDAMLKGIGCAIFGACVFLLHLSSATPALACDVQLGRPNSCSQMCDGDFINGPEIISCAEHIRQKRGAAARATEQRENAIREQDRIRQQQIEAKRAADLAAQKAERDRVEAERERLRQIEIQKEIVDKRAADRAVAEERKRERELEIAAKELELKRQQFELAEKERESRAKERERQAKEAVEKNNNIPSVGAGLSGAIILGILAVGFFVKPGHSFVKFGSMIGMPLLTFVVKYYFGFELKGDVTLAEWPLFVPAFGGMVLASIMYKYG